MTKISLRSKAWVRTSCAVAAAGALVAGGTGVARAQGDLPGNADVCFYVDIDYGGESYCLSFPGADPLNPNIIALDMIPGEFNDRFSSLRVKPGVTVSMWADSHARGDGASVTYDVVDLRSFSIAELNFHDRISSVFVLGPQR